MHRLIVAILAAVDAAIAVAVGVAATLAPLTLLWVFGFGDAADWGALWPASAAIWQFGNLVPLARHDPGRLPRGRRDRSGCGILHPFARPARVRGVHRDLRRAIGRARLAGRRLDHRRPRGLGDVRGARRRRRAHLGERRRRGRAVAGDPLPRPRLRVPALVAAVVTEWREAGAGVDRPAARPRRGGAARLGRGARPHRARSGGRRRRASSASARSSPPSRSSCAAARSIALYEAATSTCSARRSSRSPSSPTCRRSSCGASRSSPGPGFALGEGTSVSPAGTQVGVVPGIPILGIIPESTTPWLLLLALGPVALGALAGWIARSRLRRGAAPSRSRPPATVADRRRRRMPRPIRLARRRSRGSSPTRRRRASRDAPSRASPTAGARAGRRGSAEDPIGARLVVALGIAVARRGRGRAARRRRVGLDRARSRSPRWDPSPVPSRSPSGSR